MSHIALQCVLARMTARAWVPDFMQAGGQVLHDVFSNWSNGDIKLDVNAQQLLEPPLAGNLEGSWAYHLHEATKFLTKNKFPPPPPRQAQRIAVVVADFYRPYPSALGVMFDRGFDPGDDANSNKMYTAMPREGCAIFTAAIKDYRGSLNASQKEALFTTIHEMGHLFNLPHAWTQQPHFMSQSASSGPYGTNAYRFLPNHADALSHCSQSPNIWPGGTDFADTGEFAHLSLARRGKSSQPFGLEMIVSMGQREFWAFEPVELDLELRVAPGVERRFRVPDALDHGYDLFDIWIEEPGGERRKLRSPRIYCSPLKTRTITPAAPFRRDISIFGEAGGYAFRKAGLHAVWAEFEPRPGHKLVSNRLEVHVRGRGCEDKIQDERAMLANSKAAKTLYHRLPIAKAKQLGDLAEFARTAKLQSRGAIAYGLGRAMLHGTSAKAKAEASDLLARAAQEKVLGDHQRAIAFELTERG